MRCSSRNSLVSAVTDPGNFPGTLDVIAVNMKRDLPNEDERTF